MSNLSKNLKLLLLKTNMSEYNLAKKTGIPQQMINRITSGINQNPKLATILPIANYFKVPLQELITGNAFSTEKIPLIDFYQMEINGLEKAISETNKFISIDLQENKQYFATTMYDDSMEPKFPLGSILVFEKDKPPANGDFCLLKSDNHKYIFRQIIINSSERIFIKCLNPSHNEYEIMLLPINIYVLATLLEARTKYSDNTHLSTLSS